MSGNGMDQRPMVKTKKANGAKHHISQTTTPPTPRLVGPFCQFCSLELGKKSKKLGRILPTGGRFLLPLTPRPVFA